MGNKVFLSSLEIRKTTKRLETKALSNCIETLGLTKIQQHIFIYADQIMPKCGAKKASLEAWQYLKGANQTVQKSFLSHKIVSVAHSQPKPTACEFVALGR